MAERIADDAADAANAAGRTRLKRCPVAGFAYLYQPASAVVCRIHCSVDHLTARAADMQARMAVIDSFNISCILLGNSIAAILADNGILASAFQVTRMVRLAAANTE